MRMLEEDEPLLPLAPLDRLPRRHLKLQRLPARYPPQEAPAGTVDRRRRGSPDHSMPWLPGTQSSLAALDVSKRVRGSEPALRARRQGAQVERAARSHHALPSFRCLRPAGTNLEEISVCLERLDLYALKTVHDHGFLDWRGRER